MSIILRDRIWVNVTPPEGSKIWFITFLHLITISRKIMHNSIINLCLVLTHISFAIQSNTVLHNIILGWNVVTLLLFFVYIAFAMPKSFIAIMKTEIILYWNTYFRIRGLDNCSYKLQLWFIDMRKKFRKNAQKKLNKILYTQNFIGCSCLIAFDLRNQP